MIESLESISAKVRACTLCALSEGRNNAVPGEGPQKADLFVVGEAPGRYEDIRGMPFVGMSGKFLDRYLGMAGVDRSKAFVTNAVKCRPPNNRKPFEGEVAACRPYLVGQLSAVKPKLVLVLGTSACNSLGVEYKHLSDVRGKRMRMDFQGLKLDLFVTFHPSFPMRFKSKREVFLSDLKIVKNILECG